LFIGGALLGTGTLNDLSLVLFVGMLSGTYSSLCIATPVLADLKEREPAMRKLRERVERRQAGGRAAAKRAAEATTRSGSAGQLEDVPVTAGADDHDDTEAVLADQEASELTTTPASTSRPTATRTVRQQQTRRPGTSGQRRKRR
jgi:preprotein translocase subunit SecF